MASGGSCARLLTATANKVTSCSSPVTNLTANRIPPSPRQQIRLLFKVAFMDLPIQYLGIDYFVTVVAICSYGYYAFSEMSSI